MTILIGQPREEGWHRAIHPIPIMSSHNTQQQTQRGKALHLVWSMEAWTRTVRGKIWQPQVHRMDLRISPGASPSHMAFRAEKGTVGSTSSMHAAVAAAAAVPFSL